MFSYSLLFTIVDLLYVYSPSSDNNLGFVERGRVENGGMIGPRIFHTGDVIYGAGAGGIHNDVADEVDAQGGFCKRCLVVPLTMSSTPRASRERRKLQPSGKFTICN